MDSPTFTRFYIHFYVGIFIGISALCRHFGSKIGIIAALKSALSALKIGTQSTPQVVWICGSPSHTLNSSLALVPCGHIAMSQASILAGSY